MDALERLLAEQDCRELVYRAAAYVDNNNPAAFAELFTEDAVLVRPGGETLNGREAIRAAYERRPADRITRHVLGQTLVSFNTSDAAQGLSLVHLWIGSTSSPDGPHGRPAHAQSMGEFDDHFTLTPRGWRIARRQARFILHGATPAMQG